MQSKVTIVIQEEKIPVRPEVMGACEMLGLDPLYVANEGKLIAIVASEDAESILKAMRQDPLGKDAAIIGKIEDRQAAGAADNVSGQQAAADDAGGRGPAADLLKIMSP